MYGDVVLYSSTSCSYLAVVDPVEKAVQCRSNLWCICEVEQVVGSPGLVREDHFLKNTPAGGFECWTCRDQVNEGLVLIFLAESTKRINLRVNFVFKIRQGVMSRDDPDQSSKFVSSMN